MSEHTEAVAKRARDILVGYLEAPSIGWCETHEASETAIEEPGVCWLFDGTDDCSIVRMRLVPEATTD